MQETSRKRFQPCKGGDSATRLSSISPTVRRVPETLAVEAGTEFLLPRSRSIARLEGLTASTGDLDGGGASNSLPAGFTLKAVDMGGIGGGGGGGRD